MISQPPNSPDFNILDLGFFRALQSEIKSNSRNFKELIANVHSAFNKLSHKTLDDNFLTLQKCLESSIRVNGGNNYELPHMGKTACRNAGDPITEVVCEDAIYNLARNLVRE